MAISTPLALLRRTIGQRLNYWGGNISTNGPGAFTATGTNGTAIDSTRSEPDDEWSDAWIVLNPGSSDQTNAPTVWQRTAASGGWVSSTGTFSIIGTWASPYSTVGPGFQSGTSTSVGVSTLTDNTQTWTTNQWKGHTITTGSSTAFVLSNTGTVLTLTSAGWAGGTPTTGTYTITLPYEIFKVFRPEAWLQAINWSLANSYPKRHVAVNFEIPEDQYGRIVKWGELVKNLALSNPTAAPTVTEVANGQGTFQAGQYTFSYTYYNDLGETLVSPTVTVNFAGTNSMAQFANISAPLGAIGGARYYCSLEPGDTQLGLMSIGRSTLVTQPPPSGILKGENFRGTIYALNFTDPYSGYQAFPPLYNTTNVDVQELHHILRRINPGGYPEIWNDLGSDLYKSLGGKSIMLMYLPLQYMNIRLICSAVLPLMSKETDVTDEPPELVYAGSEYYLWNLLVKTSTIVNTNWKDLAKEARATFSNLLGDYALDLPRTIAYRPVVRTQY